MQTSERFAVGQRVELSLGFPGLLEPVALRGEVVWVRPPREDSSGGVGIRVADEADRRRLDDVLGGRASRAVVAPDGGYKVLLVEDNPLVVEMYSYVLKKLATAELRGKVPMEVHFAADGHAALQALAAGRLPPGAHRPVHAGDGRLRAGPEDEVRSAAARHPCGGDQRGWARGGVARAEQKVWRCTSASRSSSPRSWRR